MTLPRLVGKGLLWPLRRFFDPRMRGLAQQIDVRSDDLVRRLEEVRGEAARACEESIRLQQEMRAALDELRALIHAETEAATEATTLIGRSLADILALLDRGEPTPADGRRPASASAPGDGRVAEAPYVFRALAGLESNASVLIVGGGESPVCLSLASLGYRVTLVGSRPYPISHPLLRVVTRPIEEWEHDGTFDAAVWLPGSEPVGESRAGRHAAGNGVDLAAIRRLSELLQPGGLLVLATPFENGGGHPRRAFDRTGLDRLLDGWILEDVTVLRRQDSRTWVPAEAGTNGGGEDAEAVAMVTARRSV